MSESGTNRPFFIVGCGRSGTSLFRSILNCHRDIAIPLESLFIVDYLQSKTKINLIKLIRLIIREPEIKEWGIKVGIEDFTACNNIASVIRKCHEKYANINGKKIWGQKTPRIVRYLELINQNFPDARFIHLVRDPRAVAESLQRSNVHRSNVYYAAKRWKNDVQSGLAFAEKYPEKILLISYEELVRDRDLVLKKVLSFLDLPFNDKVMCSSIAGATEYSEFYKNIHSNLDRELTREFTSLWQSKLSLDEIRIIETICYEFMTALGYKKVCGRGGLSQMKILRMKINRIGGLITQLKRYIVYRPSYLFYMLWRKWRLGILREFARVVNL